ncbi:MAG TPA: hypothetical protein VMC02_01890 [Steroidobacteraceae bacterium]|nr:hypothetical protein [Steroidobacteraceae bacterium]
MALLERLFLRLYSRNLGRAWRNEPDAAWGDAKFSLEILIGVPLGNGLATLWLIGIDLFPLSLGKIGMPTGAMVAVAIVVWCAMEISFRFKFMRFKDAPDLALGFNKASDKVGIVTAIIASIASSMAIVLIAFWLNRQLSPAL